MIEPVQATTRFVFFASIERTMPDERTWININESKASAEATLAKLSASQTETVSTGKSQRTSQSFASRRSIKEARALRSRCFTPAP